MQKKRRKIILQHKPIFDESDEKAISRVIRSGWISEGIETKKFEENYRKFVGTKYAIVTTSGTSALFLSLLGSGIKSGDEVIVPNMTFVATATAVNLLGAKPVLAEIREDNFTISISSINKKITKKTKAIIPVHLNGRATNLDELQEICTKHNIKLIEDASQGLGSKYKNKHLGSIGDAAVFSLAPTKIITTGQGGMITTNNFEIFDKIVLLKDQGRRNKADKYDIVGYNFKFTDIQAAIGNSQFSKLNKRLSYINELYKHYTELLRPDGVITVPTKDNDAQLWYFDILTKKRQSLVDHLNRFYIVSREFAKPLHTHPPYHVREKFPISEKISLSGLYLPSHVELTHNDVEYVCKKINSFS